MVFVPSFLCVYVSVYLRLNVRKVDMVNDKHWLVQRLRFEEVAAAVLINIKECKILWQSSSTNNYA